MRRVSESHPLVLFDGVCHLCDGAVQFIIRRDPRRRFRYASLQSDVGREILEKHQVPASLDTMVLIEGGRAYVRSDAALRIARGLRFPWPVVGLFVLIPRFLRDGVYDWVARHRYRWFGKSEQCRLPQPGERELFLESADDLAQLTGTS